MSILGFPMTPCTGHPFKHCVSLCCALQAFVVFSASDTNPETNRWFHAYSSIFTNIYNLIKLCVKLHQCIFLIIILQTVLVSMYLPGIVMGNPCSNVLCDRLSVNNCGGWLYSTEGYITSPNYPQQYPNNMDCVWVISPGSEVIELEFLHVE